MGHEGISAVASVKGTTATCLQTLGGALSIDQLRWIYSSAPLARLKMDESFDKHAAPFSDGNNATHLWSELNENCTATEIKIAHVQDQHGALEYMTEKALKGFGENIATDRIQQSNNESPHYAADSTRHLSLTWRAMTMRLLSWSCREQFHLRLPHPRRRLCPHPHGTRRGVTMVRFHP